MTPNFVTLTGKELGSVTLKRVGLFCFPIKHSTHTHSIDGTLKIPINRPPIHTRVNRYREHVTHVNKRNTEFAHTCLREQHTLCTFLVNAGLFAPLKTGPPLDHWHPAVRTYEARQSSTRNTLVCASRTNNIFTFPARPRKCLCQDSTSPKSHCLLGCAHVHAHPCAVRHQFRILMNSADLPPPDPVPVAVSPETGPRANHSDRHWPAIGPGSEPESLMQPHQPGPAAATTKRTCH
jgi:hypothetical protein